MKPGIDYVGLGCGAMIVDESGAKTLLLKRSQNSRNGKGEWCRPGGMVEFGETLEEALKRETLEEAGVEINIIRLLGYTDHLTENEHWISIGALAEIKKGTPQNMEPDKHDEIKWFSFDNLPENISQPTRDGIDEYLRLSK